MSSTMLEISASDRIGGVVTAPPSKSVSHRALIAAALARGISKLQNVLLAEDTTLTANALRDFGVKIEQHGNTTIVHGTGGQLTAPSHTLQLDNSGTSMRFLTGIAAIASGTTQLDGSKRLRERPMSDLLGALQACGIQTASKHGFPPLSITGGKLGGGTIRLLSGISSQFVSALALVAPFATENTTIILEGTPVSESYIDMTLHVMNDFGVPATRTGNTIVIPHGETYTARDYTIEGDFSSASYFFGLAALTGKSITVRGLRSDSTQGDRQFIGALTQMGCTHTTNHDLITITGQKRLIGIEIDMHTMPDAVPTLAAVALLASTPTKIRNVAHLRHKECDRLQVLASELRTIGARIEEHEDGLTVFPIMNPRRATLDTHDDHRMAMSFALLGSRIPGIRIIKPSTSKSYPNFWNDFESVGMHITQNNVVLTGFRGTGKTAIGRRLAQKMSLPFVDIDTAIEEQSGCTIREMVARDGWDAFRQLESAVCEKVATQRPVVIATGGGTMMTTKNASKLSDQSVVVLLTADTSVIRERIAGSDRPSVTGRGTIQEIETLLQEREPIYKSHATITVDTGTDHSIDEKAERILSRIKQL